MNNQITEEETPMTNQCRKRGSCSLEGKPPEISRRAKQMVGKRGLTLPSVDEDVEQELWSLLLGEESEVTAAEHHVYNLIRSRPHMPMNQLLHSYAGIWRNSCTCFQGSKKNMAHYLTARIRNNCPKEGN